MVGYSSNRLSELVHHVQAFMISSFKSKYKEMVKLVPVKRNTAKFLKDNLIAVIESLENAGFNVVLCTCDNSSINRNTCEQLCGKNNFFKSPTLEGEKIFFITLRNMLFCV